MRLPLHIAVCARPRGLEGHSTELTMRLSSSEAGSVSLKRTTSHSSLSTLGLVSTTGSLATHSGNEISGTVGQVYNPQFSRTEKDSLIAFSKDQRRRDVVTNECRSGTFSSIGSVTSQMGNIQRQPFLQHTIIRDVLELYPEAASVVDNHTGKLPIVLAIENGKSFEMAVEPLINAYPKPFGGGGDGGMALPDDSEEATAHRVALQTALLEALSCPYENVRAEAIRTAGKLAEWGGWVGMPQSLDKIISEWLDIIKSCNIELASEAPASPEGIVVGPGADGNKFENIFQTNAPLLTALAEVLSHSREESVSERVAIMCLDTGRDFLFAKDLHVREAAARVLGSTLDAVGDADDAFNVIREALNMVNEDGSVPSISAAGRGRDVISKHGRLLAINAIISTRYGGGLMANEDIREATIAMVRGSIKDRNIVIRSTGYRSIGPILGKSLSPDNIPTGSTPALKELRSDILRGTRASEQADVQLALARGLTRAARIQPDLFLCRAGMPIMDAALMLAISTSSNRPNVQKSFQIFLWVALRMGKSASEDDLSPGLARYISLAEGENGPIMMRFVTQTLADM